MEILTAQLINGLAIGSIFALVLIGLNLLLLVRGILQFSYPHMVVLSMYAAWFIIGLTGGNLTWGILTAVLTCTLLSICVEPIFRSLAVRLHLLESLVAAIGISIIITEMMSHFLNFGRPIAFPATLRSGGGIISYGTISFSLGNIYTLIGCIAIMIVLLYLLYHSKEGMAFRAMAYHLQIARLLGISVNRTSIYSFAAAGLLGGITAVLLAMSLGSASANLGNTLMFQLLAVLMFAGMGNLKGGVICGVLFGLAITMSVTFLPGRWTEAVVFGLIMIAIMIWPKGIFGTQITIEF
jgi:branched-chain amino acid transport system permease protein